MIFGKKKKNSIKCEICNSKIQDKYSFCPYCGSNLIDKEQELKNFGMLGKSDLEEDQLLQQEMGFGITDKLISSLMNSLMKNLNKQFKEIEKTEIKTFPNGIRIKIGPNIQQQANKRPQRKPMSSEQIEKMSSFPRAAASSNVKRLGNKVIYELNTPGIESIDDVFVSKTESGYEIKAIGDKKIFVNTLPVELPLKSFSISDNKLLVEFATQGQF